MAHQWRGVIREYAARLPMLDGAPVVTLQEGGTPLIPCENLSELTDFKGYQEEFLRLFGFGIPGVDYEADVDPVVPFDVAA